MTITSTRYLEPVSRSKSVLEKDEIKPPQRLWPSVEAPFKGYHAAPSEGYKQSSSDTAIVIDNGQCNSMNHICERCADLQAGAGLVRAGWSFDKAPRMSFPANVARYRDRKINRTVSYVGYDAFADATTRGQIRNAFEPGSSVVGNWDVMEGILDYTFTGLGLDGAEGGLERPVLMTEPLANLAYTRKSANSRCVRNTFH